MDEEQTCGRGLAEHSALPAKLSELMAAMERVLEMHLQSLDARDDEYGAYAQLVQQFRSVAAQLHSTADQMAGYRDLPMAKHDVQALMDPANMQAFSDFVRLEEELQELLVRSLERDRAMLEATSHPSQA